MRRGPALSAIATLSTLSLTGTALVVPAHASEAVSLSPDTTTTGGRPRDLDVDAARQQLSVPVQQGSVLPGQDADAPAGHIARIDLADPQTQQRYQVTQPRPSDVVSSADGSRLYVLNASHGSITVLDARSGAVEREIEGVVTSSNGIVLDSDSGDLYVFDNFGLQRVIPGTGGGHGAHRGEPARTALRPGCGLRRPAPAGVAGQRQ